MFGVRPLFNSDTVSKRPWGYPCVWFPRRPCRIPHGLIFIASSIEALFDRKLPTLLIVLNFLAELIVSHASFQGCQFTHIIFSRCCELCQQLICVLNNTLNWYIASPLISLLTYLANLIPNLTSKIASLQIDNGDVEVGGMRKDAGVHPMLDLPESSPSRWPAEFEKKQQEIIELWHECNVSLVHRACFFLLFRGDPADSFYMEVELRRLSFLKNTSQKNLDKTPSQDSLHISQTSRYVQSIYSSDNEQKSLLIANTEMLYYWQFEKAATRTGDAVQANAQEAIDRGKTGTLHQMGNSIGFQAEETASCSSSMDWNQRHWTRQRECVARCEAYRSPQARAGS